MQTRSTSRYDIPSNEELQGSGKPHRQLKGYKINVRLEGSGFTLGNAEDSLKIWASYQFGNGDYYRDRTSMNKKKK